MQLPLSGRVRVKVARIHGEKLELEVVPFIMPSDCRPTTYETVGLWNAVNQNLSLYQRQCMGMSSAEKCELEMHTLLKHA